ncbi:hypothetical protein MKEN_00043700 [Mycena kentingensis (nom. inval.)]|nr:hypothetical protein MKEN_00043700 [Mycena kentingensis (nom. inval.)]
MSIASHDQINLKRLVRRLKKSAAVDADWPADNAGTYIKVQGALQRVKYARKLLSNVELEDVNPSPKSALRHEEFKVILDRVDSFLRDLEKKTTPKPTRPEPILPTIPPPRPEPESRAAPPEPLIVDGHTEEEATSASLPTDDLLLSVSDVARSSFSSSVSPPLTNLLPPSFPQSGTDSSADSRVLLGLPEKPTKSTGVLANPTLQNSTLRQREMADQMAVMAEQLKRNSVYFAELLEKDKRVMEETEHKLGENFGYMQKTRLRTRDLRGKTGGTTCLVLLIVVFVTVLFFFMVSLIRFSGR